MRTEERRVLMNHRSLIASVFGNLSCVAEIIPADVRAVGLAVGLLRAGELGLSHGHGVWVGRAGRERITRCANSSR